MIEIEDYFESGAECRRWLVECFAFVNLAFLALDVYMAHSANEFAVEIEWLPVVFSGFAPLLLVPALFRRTWDRGVGYYGGLLVGGGSVLIGVVGMVLHLQSSFFIEQTLHSLVYSAPFVAPLSYAGVGLLILLNRLEHDNWGRWVLLLSLAGFIGNFGLSVLDHAQNGFFYKTEWIPVVASGYGVAFLAMSFLAADDERILQTTLGVMGLQAVVGLVGFGLHLAADLGEPGHSMWDDFIYGAPVFAPLLFANLALLAAIGLWECWDEAARTGDGD